MGAPLTEAFPALSVAYVISGFKSDRAEELNTEDTEGTETERMLVPKRRGER